MWMVSNTCRKIGSAERWKVQVHTLSTGTYLRYLYILYRYMYSCTSDVPALSTLLKSCLPLPAAMQLQLQLLCLMPNGSRMPCTVLPSQQVRPGSGEPLRHG